MTRQMALLECISRTEKDRSFTFQFLVLREGFDELKVKILKLLLKHILFHHPLLFLHVLPFLRLVIAEGV